MEQFAVLFDMDGLMLDTERMARAAWTRALAEQGYALDDHVYLHLIGHTVQDTETLMKEILGPELPFKQLFDLRQSYYEADIDTNGIPVKAGLPELLDFLEAHQIPKAVASSTPCWFATHKLSHANLQQRFAEIVCGDMVQHGKPAPDLFLEAARRLNIPPRQCIVLEDSEAGIQAASRAGMLPIMVPDLKSPTPELRALSYAVLPSLLEAIPLFEQFLHHGLPQVSK